MLTLCKALLDIYYAITSPLLKHGWKVVPNVPHGNETQTAGSPDVTADLLWDSQHIILRLCFCPLKDVEQSTSAHFIAA